MRERDQTHSYWYIPSAPRVNYSLLVMESAGMMKMATGEGSPSGRVPEQGPDWLLVATEACSGGTSDLGYVLEVWGYIRCVGVGTSQGDPRGNHKVGSAPLPRGVSVGPPNLFSTPTSPINPQTSRT